MVGFIRGFICKQASKERLRFEISTGKLEMSSDNDEQKTVLPHHEQLPLCTTRLPYRQGRKLTAVKAYTINDESNHLLIFGVPSLKLRQEAKSLFLKFGKLLQFSVSPEHPSEQFTESYHARYERIQSARIAKRMLDTKSFYGGCLHICYAPEFESIEETKSKLSLRKRDVIFRLKNLQKEAVSSKESDQSTADICEQNKSQLEIGPVRPTNEFYNQVNIGIIPNSVNSNAASDCLENSESRAIRNETINMGENNIIYLNKKLKRKAKNEVIIEKKFKPNNKFTKDLKQVEVVDCTSTEKEVISNINEALNYKNFGNEIIKKVDAKPVNRIVFNFNKKA